MLKNQIFCENFLRNAHLYFAQKALFAQINTVSGKQRPLVVVWREEFLSVHLHIFQKILLTFNIFFLI